MAYAKSPTERDNENDAKVGVASSSLVFRSTNTITVGFVPTVFCFSWTL